MTTSRRSLLQAMGALGLASLGNPAQALALGERVTWPTVALLDGRRLPPGHWQQQAVVVVFFATYCGYCLRHNVHVSRLIQQSQGLPLKVLAVAHDRHPDTVRQHLQQRGLRFDVTMDDQAMHAALSPRRVTPLTCVVDRQGLLREVIAGEMFEDDVLGLAKWAKA